MNILIIGKNSYIGAKTRAHLERFSHTVKEVDTVTDEWQQVDYSGYDAVVHVAAIVHDDAKTASPALFDRVNVQLPLAVAEKAKQAGVKQFVFLSTMAVYGVDKALSADACRADENTPLNPVSMYGKTKWEAEQKLTPLQDDSFTVSVVRPPNVYGPACKGNYMGLFQKLAKLLFICPKAFTNVRQSMLYVDNLAELIRLVIEKRESGVFLPQDDVIPSTVDLVEQIRRAHGKKTWKSGLLGFGVKLCGFLPPVKKLYGGMYYPEEASRCFDGAYRLVSFEDGIKETYKQ